MLSPLAGDGLAVLPLGQTNGLALALEMATGKTLWIAKGGKPVAGVSWSSPMLIRMGQRRLIVLPTLGNLVGIDAADGKVLWEEECYEPSVNGGGGIYTWACPPAFDDGLFFIYGGYRSKMGGTSNQVIRWSTYRLIADGQRIEKVWNKLSIAPYQENAVVHDGRLYGTGNTTWSDLDENPGLLLDGQSHGDLAKKKGEQSMAHWRKRGNRDGMHQYLGSAGVGQGHPLVCQDLKTGRIEGRRGLHLGSSCFGDQGVTVAGDRLYVSRSGGQGEMDAVYLVEASPSMAIHGTLTFPLKEIIASQGKKAGWGGSLWTRPIVARGFMLIRIGAVLRAYDLRGDGAPWP